MNLRRIFIHFLFAVFLIAGQDAAAQSTGTVAGTVVDAESEEPLPGVNVVLAGTQRGAATNRDGSFRIASVPTGAYTLEARFVGYRPAERSIEVQAGETIQVRLQMHARSVEMQGIEVTALRPDLQPTAKLEAASVREANPRDSGELLRSLSGLDAVRRGPVGLDPVIRGLRETEVGVYLDGTRMFPAGPARMDSPMSHFDPGTIQSMEVVKGPYALTWGAGNLSAIRVQTRGLQSIQPGFVHGRFASGYDTNFGAVDGSISMKGRQDAFAYRIFSAWREGNDYETGDATSIPADFLSREVRSTFGYELAPGSQLSVSAGYQNQRNIDYPGRLLNADLFDTYNLSARWTLERNRGLVRSAEVLGYYNTVDHRMDNDDKPTAEPDPNRMPPFPIDVTISSEVDIVGGRVDVKMAPRGLAELEVGADIYSALRDARRRIVHHENRNLLFADVVWPAARITDAGVFTRAERKLGADWRLVGTVRLDVVHADADTASTFFREEVAADMDDTEVNPSGALTMSFAPNSHWTVSLGVGSAVRTADATERYSDRLPASKAQTSAEFVGTPDLDPERSTQVDLWVEAGYPRWSASLNAFGRHMDHYITLRPTDLPKRLPLSPPTVFQYINGEATFYGGEVSAAYRLIPALTVQGATSYLWGKDETLDEPALGVSPLQTQLGLRYEPQEGHFFLEGTVHLVDDQDRVATTRGETPTDGYTTVDLKGGITFTRRVSLQLGVTNLLDKTYVNHLNAKNPFTGQALPEPGRVFFADLTVAF